MADITKLIESTTPFAMRYNGHEAAGVRCCCDRCAHLAHYLAAHIFHAQCDGMEIAAQAFAQREWILRIGGGNVDELVKAIVAENRGMAREAEEIAKQHWKECAPAGSVQ